TTAMLNHYSQCYVCFLSRNIFQIDFFCLRPISDLIHSDCKTKILVETAMNWTDARRYCMVYHTDLLSIRNQAENNEIQSMVPAEKLAWIGLFEDSWKWSDGSYSSFRYWSQGLVDSLGESPKCAYVYDRKWSLRSCDTKSMFLCYCKWYASLCKFYISA
uniref:C-type lectin domain-containing protein n=1 Tax=Sander lucioperca TaxID=283035 RepID=A0A8C9X198_SANLU